MTSAFQGPTTASLLELLTGRPQILGQKAGEDPKFQLLKTHKNPLVYSGYKVSTGLDHE